MNPADWSGDRIIAAVIVGSCTLTAALIKAYVEMRGARAGRKGKKRKIVIWQRVKSVATAVIVAGGVTFAALLTGGFLEAPNPAALLRAATGPSAERPGPDKDDTHAYAEPYASWLRVEGTTIYYHTTEYLPGVCPGKPTAHGSWADGPDESIPVSCVGGGWLAFDVNPLAEEGLILPRITYCVNFQDSAGVWARHALEGAPGFDAVAIPADRIPPGRAIGFRIEQGHPFDRVVLTREFPRAAC